MMKLYIKTLSITALLLLAFMLPLGVNAQSQYTGHAVNVISAPQGIITFATIKDKQAIPLAPHLLQGNLWQGFTTMVTLGIKHFKAGTDHLLFLLTLLLSAPLVAVNKRWAGAGSTMYGLINVFKIMMAFVAGHLVTLLICALGLIHFPGRLIEVLIAVSILLSALHTLKPIFPGKEIYLAAGFGLVHGMAFVQTLANFNLDTSHMAVSVLGFNIGLELMQLFLIAVTIPWLFILSRTFFYTTIRITCAAFAGIAALAWIAEHATQNTNAIAAFVTQAAEHTKWVILLFAVIAVFSFLSKSRSSFSHGKEWQ